LRPVLINGEARPVTAPNSSFPLTRLELAEITVQAACRSRRSHGHRSSPLRRPEQVTARLHVTENLSAPFSPSFLLYRSNFVIVLSREPPSAAQCGPPSSLHLRPQFLPWGASPCSPLSSRAFTCESWSGLLATGHGHHHAGCAFLRMKMERKFPEANRIVFCI
jgi:hypothetical protein